MYGPYARQPPPLLGVVGQVGQVGEDHVGLEVRAQQGGHHPELLCLLGQDAVEPEVVQAGTAVLLGYVEPQCTELSQAGEQLSRHQVLLRPLVVVRDDLPLEERPDAAPVVGVLGFVEAPPHPVNPPPQMRVWPLT